MSVILDEKGNAVSESALLEITRSILEPELEELLRTEDSKHGAPSVQRSSLAFSESH